MEAASSNRPLNGLQKPMPPGPFSWSWSEGKRAGLLCRVHLGAWGQHILFHCQEKALISPLLLFDTPYSKVSLQPPWGL